jgi:hypothetical protein
MIFIPSGFVQHWSYSEKDKEKEKGAAGVINTLS